MRLGNVDVVGPGETARPAQEPVAVVHHVEDAAREEVALLHGLGLEQAEHEVLLLHGARAVDAKVAGEILKLFPGLVF